MKGVTVCANKSCVRVGSLAHFVSDVAMLLMYKNSS